MNLKRGLHIAYRALAPKDLNNIAKSVWGTVAVFLYSLFRSPDGGFADGEDGLFIGDAFEPIAAGGATVELKTGLALIRKTGAANDYDGGIRPLFSDTVQELEFSTNTKSNPRIDSIFVRPVVQQVDEEVRWFRDPTQKKKYRDSSPTGEVLGFRIEVEEGVTASSPSAHDPPDEDGPWLRVADVTRPSGQSGVNTDDIADMRQSDDLSLTDLHLSPGGKSQGGGLRLLEGAFLLFSNGTAKQRFGINESEDRLELKDVSDLINTGWGELAVGFLASDILRPITNSDFIDFESLSGSSGAGGAFLRALQPHTDDEINVHSTGGGIGQGTDGSGGFYLSFLRAATGVLDIRSIAGASGGGEVLSRTNLLAWGTFEWNDANTEWDLVEGVGFAEPTSSDRSSAGVYDFPLSGSWSLQECHIEGSVSNVKISTTEFFLPDFSVRDDGSGDLLPHVALEHVDLTNSDIQGDLDPSDGTILRLALAYRH